MRSQTSPISVRLHQRWFLPGEHAACEYCGPASHAVAPACDGGRITSQLVDPLVGSGTVAPSRSRTRRYGWHVLEPRRSQSRQCGEGDRVPFTLSTMGVCDVHEVAQKTGVPPWFQLYMLKDRGFVKSVIERSVSEGSKVLVFTMDLPTPGRRYREVHDGMEKDPTLLGMLGFVTQGAVHPRWALDIVTNGWPLKFGTIAGAMPKGVPYGRFVHDNFDTSTTWKDIEWIRSIFPGKLILKGILDPEDAKRAVQTNIDGILVSNHGGRQLDSVTSTIRALPKVVDAVQGQVPVFMDGGVRSGLDVLKALALGAKGCFLGRAWAYALGAAGESGVRDMLDILREELKVAMTLTGCSDVNRATPDLLLKD